jgi:DNA-binding CsgD family transcriptional regulator
MASTHGGAQSDLAAADKQNKVVEAVRQGNSFREIAQLMGLSKSQVHRLFRAGLDRIPADNVQAYRDEQLADLELARQAVLDVLAAEHVVVSNGHIVKPITGVDEDGNYIYGDPLHDDPELAAVDRLLKIQERQARILGSDADEKINLTGDLHYRVIGVDPADLA